MPKPKPTEVIRHEIVLGRKEFELVENALIYPSIVGSIKDVLPFVKDAATALALIEGIATVLELMGFDTPIPTPVDLAKWLADNGYTWDEAQKKWVRIGEILENPIGELIVDPATSTVTGMGYTAAQLLSILFNPNLWPGVFANPTPGMQEEENT
jgi:hypothetical protein